MSLVADPDEHPAVDFDPRDAATMQCPYPHYAALRERSPVHELPGEHVGRPGERVFAVTRYDLVAQVLADWRTFSSAFGTPGAAPPEHLRGALREIAKQGWHRPPTLLTADPPAHTRYRRLVAKAFTPLRVAEMGSDIARICSDLVAAMPARGEVDLLTDYCVPIPTRTIAMALGVAEERFADFKRWADASIATIGRQLDDQGWIDATHGVVELQRYFAAEFEARRSEPRDDLLTALLHAELSADDDIEGGPLELPELISIVQQLQVAGSETTASLIADAVVLLDAHHDEWERIHERPARAAAVVEEALRLSSPNQGLFRVVTMPTELGGVQIPKGATMWVLFGSANRDEAMFGADAAEFHPDRLRVAQHVAFGRGIHYCIGAPLARLEAITALQTLTRRYRRVRPVDAELHYAPSCILRGLTSLRVELEPRSTS